MTSLLWISLGVVLGIAAMFWWRRTKRKLPSLGKLGKKASVAALRRQVFKLVHDPSVAERLIDSERERHHELNERALLRKVIRRLERDRRG